MYHCIMLVMCVSIFFNLPYWVTLPRAAQLLTYVPPNGGKLNEKSKVYRDNPEKCLFSINLGKKKSVRAVFEPRILIVFRLTGAMSSSAWNVVSILEKCRLPSYIELKINHCFVHISLLSCFENKELKKKRVWAPIF